MLRAFRMSPVESRTSASMPSGVVSILGREGERACDAHMSVVANSQHSFQTRTSPPLLLLLLLLLPCLSPASRAALHAPFGFDDTHHLLHHVLFCKRRKSKPRTAALKVRRDGEVEKGREVEWGGRMVKDKSKHKGRGVYACVCQSIQQLFVLLQ